MGPSSGHPGSTVIISFPAATFYPFYRWTYAEATAQLPDAEKDLFLPLEGPDDPAGTRCVCVPAAGTRQAEDTLVPFRKEDGHRNSDWVHSLWRIQPSPERQNPFVAEAVNEKEALRAERSCAVYYWQEPHNWDMLVQAAGEIEELVASGQGTPQPARVILSRSRVFYRVVRPQPPAGLPGSQEQRADGQTAPPGSPRPGPSNDLSSVGLPPPQPSPSAGGPQALDQGSAPPASHQASPTALRPSCQAEDGRNLPQPTIPRLTSVRDSHPTLPPLAERDPGSPPSKKVKPSATQRPRSRTKAQQSQPGHRTPRGPSVPAASTPIKGSEGPTRVPVSCVRGKENSPVRPPRPLPSPAWAPLPLPKVRALSPSASTSASCSASADVVSGLLRSKLAPTSFQDRPTYSTASSVQLARAARAESDTSTSSSSSMGDRGPGKSCIHEEDRVVYRSLQTDPVISPPPPLACSTLGRPLRSSHRDHSEALRARLPALPHDPFGPPSWTATFGRRQESLLALEHRVPEACRAPSQEDSNAASPWIGSLQLRRGGVGCDGAGAQEAGKGHGLGVTGRWVGSGPTSCVCTP